MIQRLRANHPSLIDLTTGRVETVPIYLSAIGTVQAYNMVNVKTRFDGQITQVLFQEGQDVRQGDLLQQD